MSKTVYSGGIAEEVRALMARRRVTQEQLAKGTGIPQSTLSPKLSGQRAFLVDEVFAIAEYFDVAVADLLPRLDSNQQPAGNEPIDLREADLLGIVA